MTDKILIDRELLERVIIPALEKGSMYAEQTLSGYGFYRPENPNNFTPDPENSTEQEIANHKAACEAYNNGTYIPDDSDGWVTPEIHVTKAPWGIGSYSDNDDEIDSAVKQLRTALSAPQQEAVANADFCPHCNPCRNSERIAKAEKLNVEYDAVLRSVISYLAAGGYSDLADDTELRLIDPAKAEQKLRWGIDHTQPVPSVPEGLIDALRDQKQCDEDGVMCIVNREAVDDAVAMLSAAPNHPSADDRKDVERFGMVIRAMTEDGVTLENGDDLLDLLLCAQGNKAKLLHIIDAAIAAQKGDSDV